MGRNRLTEAAAAAGGGPACCRSGCYGTAPGPSQRSPGGGGPAETNGSGRRARGVIGAKRRMQQGSRRRASSPLTQQQMTRLLHSLEFLLPRQGPGQLHLRGEEHGLVHGVPAAQGVVLLERGGAERSGRRGASARRRSSALICRRVASTGSGCLNDGSGSSSGDTYDREQGPGFLAWM